MQAKAWQKKAKADPILREKLLQTRENPNPIHAFCEICHAYGVSIYEMLPEEKRFEVFDGVIYDMASPSQVHQALSMQLSTLINTYILRKKSYIF